MKIQINLLKQLIREMAYAHMLGNTVKSKSTKEKERDPHVLKRHDSLKKYHSSKGYEADAEYAFRNFKTPIWILPEFDSQMVGGPRLRVISFDEAYDNILESGLGLTKEEKNSGIKPTPENEDLRVERVQNHLNSGGSIIVPSSRALIKNFWPSPWNTLHAIADDVANEHTNPIHKKLLNDFIVALKDWESKIVDILYETLASFLKEERKKREKVNNWDMWSAIDDPYDDGLYRAFQLFRRDSMTMKSARQKTLFHQTMTDIRAETFVQAITHSKNFHINEEGIEDNLTHALSAHNVPNIPEFRNLLKEKLEEYVDKAKELRNNALETLDALIAGKIIVINVGEIDSI
jgi:hypothetical protein